MTDLIYGISNTNQKIISIEEIPDNLTGLLCNCVCASCGRDLQACSLNGKVKRYFRHNVETRNGSSRNVNCSPTIANETALHKMAKQIIAEENKIFAPCKTISIQEARTNYVPIELINKINKNDYFRYHKARLVEAQSVELEKWIADFKPDAVIKTTRGELLVEIRVSHKVDEDKKEKAQKYGAAMLEIDLRKFVDKPVSREQLRDIITKDATQKTWIHYPLTDEALAQARQYYEGLDTVKKYYQERESKQKALEKREAQKAAAFKKIEDAKRIEEWRYKVETNKRQQEILDFDYNQDEKTIEDLDGWRYAKCNCCNIIMKARNIYQYEPYKRNKGICRNCYSAKKSANKKY